MMLTKDFVSIISEKTKGLSTKPDPNQDVVSQVKSQVILKKFNWLLAGFADSEFPATVEMLDSFLFFLEQHWDPADTLVDLRCQILAEQFALATNMPLCEVEKHKPEFFPHFGKPETDSTTNSEEQAKPKYSIISWKPITNAADLAFCKTLFGTIS